MIGFNRIKKYILHKLDLVITKIIEDRKNLEITKSNYELTHKTQSLTFGIENRDKVNLLYSKGLLLGRNVRFEKNTSINAYGGVIIGSNTLIKKDVKIISALFDHENNTIYSNKYLAAPINIGSNCILSENCILLPGSNLEDNSIVLPGQIIGEKEFINYCYKGIFENISNYQTKILTNVSKNTGIKLKNENNYINNSEKILFVIGTGRSGTQSIVKTYNKYYPNVQARHEAFHQVNQLSTLFAHKEITHSKAVQNLENLFKYTYLKDGIDVYIESHARFWALLPHISEIMPNSKFVFIYRNPKEALRSMYSRKWYSKKENDYVNHPQAQNRIRADKCSFVSKSIWNKWNRFQKTVWYWAYVNTKIYENLQIISESKYKIFNLNNINLSEINMFLDIADQNVNFLTSNKTNKENQDFEKFQWDDKKEEEYQIVLDYFSDSMFFKNFHFEQN